MAAYLEYVQLLKTSFAEFELVHVPRQQNARADLLAKLASSSKGGKQRTVIQETLKVPRAFVSDNQVLHAYKSMERLTIGHRSLTQETLRAPRVRSRPSKTDESMEVHGEGTRHLDDAIPAILRSCLLYTSPSPRD